MLVPVLDEAERDALLQADHDLAGLQEALEAAARTNALDSELIERLEATARAAASRVNQHLPLQVDADARDEIRRRLIDLLTLRPDDDLQPLDVADRALIEAEAVRHVMRDLLDEQPPADMREASSAIALLEGWLPGITLKQLADLVGMSARQIQRTRQGAGASSRRIQLVARLVAILRHAWTDQGVYAWFYRDRPEFDDRPPIHVLDDPAYERALLIAARSGRVQGGL